MNKKLYKMMNWPEIESVIYSDGDHPDQLLGAHDYGKGSLIQAFFPEAESVTVVLEKKDGTDSAAAGSRITMELADEDGFYACYAAGKKSSELRYHYELKGKDGSIIKTQDCYRFPSYYREEDEKAFSAGIHYDIYRRLGAHPMKYDGVEGTCFACLAPDAARVSVVGDFNNWDGRIHQMSRFEDTDIFEIFIPGAVEGDSYQFEIRARSGRIALRNDPFAFLCAATPVGQSVITSLEGYPWKYSNPDISRRSEEGHHLPLSVYEFDLAGFHSFTEAARVLPQYVRSLGFGAVSFRASSRGGNSPYAPDRRFGTPSELMELIDAFHKAGILVLLFWNPVSFEKQPYGLMDFDLSPVFEYKDELKRNTADGCRSYFDLNNPRISDYLIANAFFLIRTYHADGLVSDDLASALYLDYGKQETAHAVNMYGGVENLDTVEFLKHLNSILRKKIPGVITVAEETAAWPGVTGPVDENHLGFNLKLHNAYREDFAEYMATDPLFREGRHDLLLDDMVYQYTENYILPLLSKDFGPAGSSILSRLPGADEKQKLAELRILLASMMVHPGSKILNLGETSESLIKNGDTESAANDEIGLNGVRAMILKLNSILSTMPAFTENDDHPDGFEWIRQLANDQDILCFLRKGSHPNDFVLVAANYSGAPWRIRTGVPYAGNYKKIFSSNDVLFGGDDTVQSDLLTADPVEADGRAHSLEIEILPTSLMIYEYEV